MPQMALNDGAADVEAQAQARRHACKWNDMRHLRESLKQGSLLIGRQTWPPVTYSQTREWSLPILCYNRQLDINRALSWGIFVSIAQIVRHHLANTVRIGVHPDGRLRRAKRLTTPNHTVGPANGHLINDVVHQRRQIHALHSHFQLARLNARYVKQVMDETFQPT